MELPLRHDLAFVTATLTYRGVVVEIADALIDTGAASTVIDADLVRRGVQLAPHIGPAAVTLGERANVVAKPDQLVLAWSGALEHVRDRAAILLGQPRERSQLTTRVARAVGVGGIARGHLSGSRVVALDTPQLARLVAHLGDPLQGAIEVAGRGVAREPIDVVRGVIEQAIDLLRRCRFLR